MTTPRLLGIDVGGTSVKARFVDATGQTIGEWRIATPQQDSTGNATADVVAQLLKRASTITEVDAVGVVVPGIVDEETGVCRLAVNLGWKDLAIRDLLISRMGRPTAFGQDVRAGALAELTSGAAAGSAGPIAFVPIGTGIAAAFAIDGVVLSSHGWAGEIGQMPIGAGRHTGMPLERVASASAIVRALKVADGREAASLVGSGDEKATAVWKDAIDALADALSWITATVAPEMIVIGGGLAESGALLFDPLTKAVAARALPGHRARIVAAQHGEAAAVVGAVELARRSLRG